MQLLQSSEKTKELDNLIMDIIRANQSELETMLYNDERYNAYKIELSENHSAIIAKWTDCQSSSYILNW